MFKLDKTAFAKVSFKEADHQKDYWLSKTPTERIQAAMYLQSVAYGFDLANPPRMDKQFYYKRKRDG